MIAKEIKRLAQAHSVTELDAAADALTEEQPLPFEVAGEDEGEQLTNLLLASRIAGQLAAGVEMKLAFREIMGDVRDVLRNE